MEHMKKKAVRSLRRSATPSGAPIGGRVFNFSGGGARDSSENDVAAVEAPDKELAAVSVEETVV